MRGDIEARSIAGPVNRPLERVVVKGRGSPAGVADQVMMVVAAGHDELETGRPFRQADALEQAELGQKPQGPVDACRANLLATFAQTLRDQVGVDAATLGREQLDDSGPCPAAAKALCGQGLFDTRSPRRSLPSRCMRAGHGGDDTPAQTKMILIYAILARPMSTLVTDRLTVSYGPTIALEDASIEIPPGSTVAVLGPNGSGKTTLLAAIAGVIAPSGGAVAARPASVAYLPQGAGLDRFFPASVADVVGMGRWGRRGWSRRADRADRDAIARAIAEVGLTDRAGHSYTELSVGQRQRTLLGQAIAQDADLMLLDEPYAGVDRPAAAEIRKIIDRWRDGGRTILVATHDLEAAASEYDLVLALNRRVIALGPAAEVCSEPVLRETFSGHMARVGADLIDTSHHHDHAG